MPLAQSIGLDTLAKYFHLPINDVAKELGVCATVLKKICRKNGIPRWPHRKIKSLDKMIITMEASVAKNPEDEERIRQEVQTLKNKRLFLMKNPNVLATKVPAAKKSKLHHQSAEHSPIHSYGTPSPPYSHSPEINPLASPSCSGLNAMVAAMYSQVAQQPFVPHPHSPSSATSMIASSGSPNMYMPYPAMSPLSPSATTSSEKKHWEPAVTDHRSAIHVPTRTNAAHSATAEQAMLLEELMHARVVPTSPLIRQHNPQPSSVQQVLSASLMHSQQTQPQSHTQPQSQSQSHSEYYILLPELRFPAQGEIPNKLATLEPDLYPAPKSGNDVPSQQTGAAASGNWQLPDWFAQAHKQAMMGNDESPVADGATPLKGATTVTLSIKEQGHSRSPSPLASPHRSTSPLDMHFPVDL